MITLTEKQIKKGEKLEKKFGDLIVKGMAVADNNTYWEYLYEDPSRQLKGFLEVKGIRTVFYQNDNSTVVIPIETLAGYDYHAFTELMKDVQDFVEYLNFLGYKYMRNVAKPLFYIKGFVLNIQIIAEGLELKLFPFKTNS